mmetsp:Transcript_44609/g.135258  ORF Transcript_44609/g.135258 Transcript_44609/m.135258 type:complete len:223 (+) Transcript_44609:532-1200(+)
MNHLLVQLQRIPRPVSDAELRACPHQDGLERRVVREVHTGEEVVHGVVVQPQVPTCGEKRATDIPVRARVYLGHAPILRGVAGLNVQAMLCVMVHQAHAEVVNAERGLREQEQRQAAHKTPTHEESHNVHREQQLAQAEILVPPQHLEQMDYVRSARPQRKDHGVDVWAHVALQPRPLHRRVGLQVRLKSQLVLVPWGVRVHVVLKDVLAEPGRAAETKGLQ